MVFATFFGAHLEPDENSTYTEREREREKYIHTKKLSKCTT